MSDLDSSTYKLLIDSTIHEVLEGEAARQQGSQEPLSEEGDAPWWGAQNGLGLPGVTVLRIPKGLPWATMVWVQAL